MPTRANRGCSAIDPPGTLECAAVGKRYLDGDSVRWVVRDVSIAVRPGSIVALWGPSGCGKSTLLGMMAGMLLPDAGEVCFRQGGKAFRLSKAAERDRVRFRRQRLGFVFQLFNLVPTLTAAENVLLPLELNRRPDLRRSALERLGRFGVGHCAMRLPETLSGGEQQRVAVARALAHEPAVLLADEPTGNLDAANTALVTEALWQAVADVGCALVVATHNRRIAERADAVIDLSSPGSPSPASPSPASP